MSLSKNTIDLKAVFVSGNFYEMSTVKVYLEDVTNAPHIPIFCNFKDGFYKFKRLTEKLDLITYEYVCKVSEIDKV